MGLRSSGLGGTIAEGHAEVQAGAISRIAVVKELRVNRANSARRRERWSKPKFLKGGGGGNYAAQTSGGVSAGQVELRQQAVSCCLDLDAIIFEEELIDLQLWAIGPSLVDGGWEGHVRDLRNLVEGRCRKDLDGLKARVRWVFGNQVQDDSFLLEHVRLRGDERLLIGSDRRFGGDDVEMGKGPDLKLALVILQKSLGDRKRLVSYVDRLTVGDKLRNRPQRRLLQVHTSRLRPLTPLSSEASTTPRTNIHFPASGRSTRRDSFRSQIL